MNNEKQNEGEIPNYVYYEQVVVRKIHHFYLSRQIEEPILYTDLVHRINCAGPDDCIHLHLNTPGGRLDTGAQIINAMQATPAHVITSIEGEAHSLGSLIFLAADEYLVHDNAIMMLHNFAGGLFGKANEQTAQLEATIKWFDNLAQKLYVPFISLEEMARIKKGEDLWFQSDEIRKRLNKMVKSYRKKQASANQQKKNN